MCVLQELGSRKKIGNVEMCSRLYLFKILQPRKASLTSNGPSKSRSLHNFSPKFVFNSSVNKDSEVMLWHYRLGHSNSYLENLFPYLFINKNSKKFYCEICQLTKHTRSIYPSVPYCPSKPFALVHNDIWGPSRVKNINRAQWFMTFMDGHTQLTWVFLMKEKS